MPPNSALSTFMQKTGMLPPQQMQQWGQGAYPKSTTEQLLPMAQSGEYNAPYIPAGKIESFLNLAQNTEAAVGGTYEAHMIREGLKKFGPAALKQIVTSPARVAGGVVLDWALPNRANDMDEVQAIKNYKQ